MSPLVRDALALRREIRRSLTPFFDEWESPIITLNAERMFGVDDKERARRGLGAYLPDPPLPLP